MTHPSWRTDSKWIRVFVKQSKVNVTKRMCSVNEDEENEEMVVVVV